MALHITKSNYHDELISDEVQNLISYRPHWIIRKGNVFFFVILSLLLASTWLIKYPDVIKGSLKLVAVNAPKLLAARTDGKLEKLLVNNDQDVQQGQPLAFLQSSGRHEQVLALKTWIGRIEPFIDEGHFEVLLSDPLPLFNQLGEMQTTYQDFQNTSKETSQILVNGYYQRKKQSLLKDERYLASIQQNEKQQQQLLMQDYELQQFEYNANESLSKDKIIAPVELNQSKSKVIAKAQGLRQMDAQLINNNMAGLNKKKEILDLEKYISDQQQKFRSELFNMKNKIEAWIQQYIVIAPEDGKVLFRSFLQENQLVSSGEELFYIKPPQNSYYGQMTVSQTGLGKIKAGQKVLIRIESFPSNEFGFITGIISYISEMPNPRDSFLIKVDLPKGLQTNYNKTIFFRNNLAADAEVMTDSRKLFDRFWGQLKDIIKR